jgi:hypothetical protein
MVTLKHVPSLTSGVQFLASFRLEKYTNIKAYMIIDLDGKINDISAGII